MEKMLHIARFMMIAPLFVVLALLMSLILPAPDIRSANAIESPLTTKGVDADLESIGYNSTTLAAKSISVKAYSGPIPKHCLSNGTIPSESNIVTVQGLAIRNVRYTPCEDGQQPLPDSYYSDGFECSVIYNSSSDKKLAILSHEIGHCMHRGTGSSQKDFDKQYMILRGITTIDKRALSELIADDFMICKHGLDTDWPELMNYYNEFGVSPPTTDFCAGYTSLADQYFSY